jgi:EAL domain-containing protein (putative c-di-GMP-specific phosphodiesterase class I)
MIERVIADLLFWQDSGVDVGRIAINGAPGDFQRGDFADRILNRLAHAGLSPSLLELEVTESVFVGQLAETVSQTLATLSEAGVKIALDDFGTGYASLTHLKQFPVDTLKIDRSFISRLDARDREDAAIVSAVIHLAKNLGITTVAEGIETPFQAAHVARQGCDIAQGFLFGRPMAAAHVSDVVLNWSAPSVLSVIASGMHARRRDSSLTTG